MRRVKRRNGVAARWSENQKLQAVVVYNQTGSAADTALLTGIPVDTIRNWMRANVVWWKEALAQVRTTEYDQLDANMRRVVDKALKVTEDRLDNGNHQYDPKTGKVIRVPVSMRDSLKATTELLAKSEAIRDKPSKQENQEGTEARLAKLAEELIRFAKARNITPTPALVGEAHEVNQ